MTDTAKKSRAGTRWTLLAIIAVAVAAYFAFDLGRYLSLDYFQSQLGAITAFRDENFLTTAAIFFVSYVAITALSIPGAAIATLAGGAIFGLGWGLLLVSFASSIGATLAFLVSRTLLREWVQRHFGSYMEPINRGIERDGSFYLFSIRMVPVFPYFMVNLLMGLTPIRTFTYYWVSQLGMLAVTAVYVNAGSELARIDSLSGLVSGSVLLAFGLLGLFPLIARLVIGKLQARKLLRNYRRPAKFDANVVVVGAGSAGLVASLVVAGAQAKVVLVEKGKMGGDCLNTGCVPSKSLLRSGRVMSLVRRAGEFGIRAAPPEADFPKVMERLRGIIKTIEPHDSVERFTSLGVECLAGEARIESPWEVRVGERLIRTRAIILATGARPRVPAIPGLDKVPYLTSDSVWSLTELPRRLLVVGGGPIGCELAQAFNNLGSEVTLVGRAPRLLPREDAEVSQLMAGEFERAGIRVLTGCQASRFDSDDVGHCLYAGTGAETVVGTGEGTGDGGERIPFDVALLALGREPNVTGFGLEALGMPLTRAGTVQVNQYMQTAYPNIYACGDVAGPHQFTHSASYQAWFAALNAVFAGWWRSAGNYRVLPWATFTEPEVARVGMNEAEAQARDIGYEVTRYPLDRHDRALADGEAQGFVKVLTVPGKDRILGVTIVGHRAGDMIGEFVLAMTHNLGLGKIAATTHIYPTMSEANKFAANAWRSARVPSKYFPLLERLNRWRRG